MNSKSITLLSLILSGLTIIFIIFLTILTITLLIVAHNQLPEMLDSNEDIELKNQIELKFSCCGFNTDVTICESPSSTKTSCKDNFFKFYVESISMLFIPLMLTLLINIIIIIYNTKLFFSQKKDIPALDYSASLQ
ncbi:Tetraspanin family protein [Entamoeba marina]